MEFTFTLSVAETQLILPEILMTLLLCGVMFVDFLLPQVSKRVLGYASAAGTGAVALLLAGYFFEGIQGNVFKDMFVLDPMAIFFKVLILSATVLVILISLDYIDKSPTFRGEYYFMVLFAALGMMLMCSANDLLSIFITVEFSTFGFYILVAYNKADLRSAGLKLFVLGVFAAGLLAFGISLLFGETGLVVLSDIQKARPPMSVSLIIGFLLVFAAMGFKIGAVPFHNWVPDIYQGAPTPVTAFLSIAPKAASFAILLRLFFATFGGLRTEWVWMIVVISMASMTYGNIVAIAQTDIKRVLAYSGIAQIGNILVGFAAATKLGGDAILYYLLTYMVANVGAFSVAVVFSNRTHSDRIEDYDGLSRRSPFLAAAMLLFLLSLAGVPPLAGFLGKLFVFVAAAREGLVLLITVGAANIVISMYYYLIVVKRMYIFKPRDPSPIAVPLAAKAVLAVTVAGTLVLGIWPQAFVTIATTASDLFSISVR